MVPPSQDVDAQAQGYKEEDREATRGKKDAVQGKVNQDRGWTANLPAK